MGFWGTYFFLLAIFIFIDFILPNWGKSTETKEEKQKRLKELYLLEQSKKVSSNK